MVAFPTIGGYDPRAYADFIRPLMRPWIEHQAWCSIYDPIAGRTVTEDPVTGAVTNVTITPAFTGWMRVQPMRTDLTIKRAIDNTTTRRVQFWPLDFPKDGLIDIRPGFEIVVIQCQNDPQLTKYQYVVDGAMNSSLAWNRTITTSVNEESRPKYDLSLFPQPPVT